MDSGHGSIVGIPLPLRHVGSVNTWLLHGEPLTLVDTGPRDDAALSALEAGLGRAGVRVEDIELVLGTHHHSDHVGLAATIRERSGAAVALLAPAADYAAAFHENVDRDRDRAAALMRAHGVPKALAAAADDMWDFIHSTSTRFDADVRLADGDVVVAGGRRLGVVPRPGHSHTDTLFVDAQARLAFAGDHLLADISSNTEMSRALPGRSARLEYLRNLRRTATMPVDRLLTGHGPPVDAPAALVTARLAEHEARAERVARLLLREPQSAYAIAQHLWPDRIVHAQPLLVVWEVLGHLELLAAAGIADEAASADGRSQFALRGG